VVLIAACNNHETVKKGNPIESFSIQKDDKIQQNIKAYFLTNGLSGSVAVVQDNRTIVNEGIGYADKRNKILNQSTTTYPIASITKTFVATSIMMLQEQDKLNIQDPVSKYIPNFPNGSKMKLYHLLTHTSGIQHLQWKKKIYLRFLPLKGLIWEIERAPIKFQPGEKWDYQDENYMILGYIVEKVSGMDLHDFIQKNIFEQVQMNNSGFITRLHRTPYSSVGYLEKNGHVETIKNVSTFTLFGNGDIYSTAYDLTKYDQALMNGRLISKESLKEVLTPSSKSSYGLGLYNKGNIIYSIGGLGGWYSMHAYYPGDQTYIAVLLNKRKTTTNIEQVTGDLYQIVKNKQS
jgi:CubicO group peptidase (beta-lactamase class C family)